MAKVELHQAFVWDCDECGAENFCRCVTAELPDEDREAAYRQFMELEPYQPLPDAWRDFTLTTAPNSVTCRESGTAFETVDDRAGPEMA